VKCSPTKFWNLKKSIEEYDRASDVFQPIRNLKLVPSQTLKEGGTNGLLTVQSKSLGESGTLKQIFPEVMTISQNYGNLGLDYIGGNHRLHNTEVLLFFNHGNELICVLLTLEEAESIRRVLQQNSNTIDRFGATLVVLKFDSANSKQDRTTMSRVRYSWTDLEYSLDGKTLTKNRLKPAAQKNLTQILCCCKLFDSYYYFSDIEVALLVELFSQETELPKSIPLSELRGSSSLNCPDEKTSLLERKSFHDCLKLCRQRFDAWEHSPFAKVLTLTNSDSLLSIITVTEKIKNIFSGDADLVNNLRHEFSRFDENGNGVLDESELLNAIKSTQLKRNMYSLGSDEELSAVIKHAILKSNQGGLTFTQFSLFIFGRAPSFIVDIKSALVQKQPRRFTRKHKAQSENLPRAMSGQMISISSESNQGDTKQVSRIDQPPRHLLIRNVCSIGRLIPISESSSKSGAPMLSSAGPIIVLNNSRIFTQRSEPVTIVPCATWVTGGSFFFEIEVEQLHPGSELRVGWANVSFKGRLLGSDVNSWAISGTTYSSEQQIFHSAAWNKGQSTRYGDQWRSGDVVGCLAEFLNNRVRLRFGYNGSWVSPADAVFDKVHSPSGLIPAVSLSRGVIVRMNCGKYNYRYVPNFPCNYLNVSEIAGEKQRAFMKQTAGKSRNSFVAVSGQDGIQLKTDSHGITTVRYKEYVQSPCSITRAACMVNSGKWFFEIKLKDRWGQWLVGWATLNCDLSQACGDTEHSWCCRISNGTISLHHNGKDLTNRAPSKSYSDLAKHNIPLIDAVIGTAVDFDAGTIQFYFHRTVSGPTDDFGIAFEGLSFSQGLIPLVSARCWCGYNVSDTYMSPLTQQAIERKWGFKPLCESSSLSPGMTLRSDAGNAMSSGKKANQPSIRVTAGLKNLKMCNAKRNQVVLESLKGFPSARIDNISLTGGMWYFEVAVNCTGVKNTGLDEDDTTIHRQNLTALGWSQASFFGCSEEGTGIGDERGTYAYCGFEHGCQNLTKGYQKMKGNLMQSCITLDMPELSLFGIKSENIPIEPSKLATSSGNEMVESKLWNIGDVVGFAADLDNRCIAAVHWRGSDPPHPNFATFFEGIDVGTGLSPTFSLNAGFKITVSMDETDDSTGCFTERRKAAQKFLNWRELKPISASTSASEVRYRQTQKPRSSKSSQSYPVVRCTRKFTLESNSKNKIESKQIEIFDSKDDILFGSEPSELIESLCDLSDSDFRKQIYCLHEQLSNAFKVCMSADPCSVSADLVTFHRENKDGSKTEAMSNPLDLDIVITAEVLIWSDCMSEIFDYICKHKDKVISLRIIARCNRSEQMKTADERIDSKLHSVLHQCSRLRRFSVDKLTMPWARWGLNSIASTIDDHQALVSLEIGHDDLGSLGATKLSTALQYNSILRCLFLKNAKIDSAGASQLVITWNKSHSLTHLDLSHNLIDGSAGDDLRRMLEVYPNLKILNLSNNMLGYGVTAVAKGLEINQGLLDLNLENNQVRSDEATSLAEALRINRTLLRLNLKKCDISVTGLEELCRLFACCEHAIQEFLFEDLKLSELERLALLFSLNRKAMKLIDIAGVITLASNGFDWKAFFQSPLIFCIWYTYFQITNTGYQNDTFSKHLFHVNTKIDNILITLLIQSRNKFGNLSESEATRKNSLHANFIQMCEASVTGKIALPGTLHKGTNDRTYSKLKMPLVSDLDARDSLCLALSMLKVCVNFEDEENNDDSKSLLRSSHAKRGKNSLLWIINQMIGEDGTDGIVYEEKSISPAKAVSRGNALVNSDKNLTSAFLDSQFLNSESESLRHCERLHSATVGHLRDLWSCSLYRAISEIQKGIIRTHLPHALENVTALLCALQLGRKLEGEHSICRRLLLRNRCKRCRLIDNSTGLHYAVIISQNIDDADQTRDERAELDELQPICKYYLVNPDLCNINARLKSRGFELGQNNAKHSSENQINLDAPIEAECREGALALAAKHGLDNIVKLLLELGAAHEWEIDECVSLAAEKAGDSEKNLKLLTYVCKSPPGAEDGMLSYACDLWTKLRRCVTYDSGFERFPIHFSCVNGHCNIIGSMIRENDPLSFLNRMDSSGWTPLSLAAVHGHVNCVTLLLENKAQPILQMSKIEQKEQKGMMNKPSREEFGWNAITDWKLLYSNTHSVVLLQLFCLKNLESTLHFTDRMAESRAKSDDQKKNQRGVLINYQRPQDLKQAIQTSEALLECLCLTDSVRKETNIWILAYLVKRTAVYLIALIAVSVLALDRQNLLSTEALNIRSVYENNLFESNFPEDTLDAITFSGIQQISDFWDFVQGPISSLVWPFDSNESQINYESRVLGAVRFWQTRRLLGPCPELLGLADFNSFAAERQLICRQSEMSTLPFGPNRTYPFDHTSRGYVIDVPSGNFNVSHSIIQDLIMGDWVDSSTQSLRVMFTLYRPSQNIFHFFSLNMDAAVSAFFIPSFAITSVDWKSYSERSPVILAIDVALFLFCIWRTVRTFSSRKALEKVIHRKKFAVLRIFMVLFFDMWYALRIVCIVLEQSTVLPHNSTVFVDLNNFSTLRRVQRPFLSLGVVSLWLYSFRYLELTPTLGPMIQAVTATLTHERVSTFVAYVFFVCMCFGMGFVVHFGLDIPAFATPQDTMYQLFLGSFDLSQMQQSEYIFGTLAFFVLNVVMTLTLVNIFIGIVTTVYDDCHEKSERIWRGEVNSLITEELINNALQSSDASDSSEQVDDTMPDLSACCGCSNCTTASEPNQRTRLKSCKWFPAIKQVNMCLLFNFFI
jgi:Ca2+-binding EF-hand superfamily protein